VSTRTHSYFGGVVVVENASPYGAGWPLQAATKKMKVSKSGDNAFI